MRLSHLATIVVGVVIVGQLLLIVIWRVTHSNTGSPKHPPLIDHSPACDDAKWRDVKYDFSWPFVSIPHGVLPRCVPSTREDSCTRVGCPTNTRTLDTYCTDCQPAFLLGTAKASTSTLWTLLTGQHDGAVSEEPFFARGDAKELCWAADTKLVCDAQQLPANLREMSSQWFSGRRFFANFPDCTCEHTGDARTNTKDAPVVRRGAQLIAFDACPRLMFNFPNGTHSLRCMYPQARFVLTVRDPVKRLLSHYWDGRRRGWGSRFQKDIDEYIERLLRVCPTGAEDACPDDVRMGLYARHLRHWTSVFGPSAVLVFESMALAGPKSIVQSAINNVTDFLGASRITVDACVRTNDASRGPHTHERKQPSRVMYSKLIDLYRPHNEELFEMMGVRFDHWGRALVSE